MATGFTDFSEYDLGVQPSDWTRKNVTGVGTWTVEEDGVGGERFLQFFRDGVDAAFFSISWDQTPETQDGEIAIEFEGAQSGSEFYQLAFLRTITDGEDIQQGSVYAGMNADNNDRIREYVGVNSTNPLLDAASPFVRSTNTRYRMRCRVAGTNIKMKVWLASDPPPPWQHEVTMTEAVISGWHGLGTFRADGGIKVFKYAWATDGDSAPLDGASVVEGIPATVIRDSNNNLLTGEAVTRTITRVSDSTVLFTGSQTSDATTGELPEIDLSETAAADNDAVEDKISLDNATSPGVKSQTLLRTVENLA